MMASAWLVELKSAVQFIVHFIASELIDAFLQVSPRLLQPQQQSAKRLL